MQGDILMISDGVCSPFPVRPAETPSECRENAVRPKPLLFCYYITEAGGYDSPICKAALHLTEICQNIIIITVNSSCKAVFYTLFYV